MQLPYESIIQSILENGFEYVDNWLKNEQLLGLRKSLLERYSQDKFHPDGIGNKSDLQVIPNVRSDKIMWLQKGRMNALEQEFMNEIQEFYKYLNRTCFTGIQSHEFQYAMYEPGTFYKKHVDKFNNDDRRQLSLVLYLSKEWNTGDGGELIIYPNDQPHIIEPKPGRLVIFKSELEHEVCTSFHQRMSLTGWLKTY